MSRLVITLALATGAVAWPCSASAQQWQLGVDAGRIRNSLDAVARQSETFAAGLGYEDRSSAFRVSAGLPTPGDSLRWGAIGAWKRLAATRNGLTTGIDLSGNAFAFRVRGSATQPVDGGVFDPFRPNVPAASTTATGRAVAGQALPLVAYERGPLQLQARAGVSYYDASTQGMASDRMVGLGDLQLVMRPSAAFAIIPTVRYVVPREEAAATFASASVVAATAAGRLRLWAEAGRWIAGLDDDTSGATAWAGGGELRVAPLVSLTASARRSGYDPLHLSPAQTSWSLGASVRFGPRAKSPAPPVAVRDASGTTTIRLPGSRASSPPRVAGDFNDWTPAPMEHDGTSWRYTVAARPGVYNYAFVAPDGTWFVPEGVPGRKDDGMGGYVAMVVIR